MENMAPNGAENNASQEGILDIVRKLQALERELKTLKANQEKLRQMPDRAEKNSLLGEVEDKIRNTISTINELQDKKMKLVQEGDEKYIVKEPLQEFWAGGEKETDAFDAELRVTGEMQEADRLDARKRASGL